MSTDIQMRVRQNAEDQQGMVKDLHRWETEIDEKEQRLLNTRRTETHDTLPPIRGSDKEQGVATPLELCQNSRERGNAHFRKGEYAAALEHYSKALQYYDKDPAAYSNRAAVHLKLKQWNAAETDATACIIHSNPKGKEEVNKANNKAFFRRAQARREIGNFIDAKLDLERALILEPTDQAIKNELQLVLKALEQMRKETGSKINIEDIDVEEDSDDEIPRSRPEATSAPKVAVPTNTAPAAAATLRAEAKTETKIGSPTSQAPSSLPTQPAQTQAAAPKVAVTEIGRLEATPTPKAAWPAPTSESTSAPKASPNVDVKPVSPTSSRPAVAPKVAVSEVAPKLPSAPPTSGTQLESDWKHLQSDDELLARYTLMIDPLKLKDMMKSLLSHEFLADVVRVCSAQLGKQDPSSEVVNHLSRFLFHVASVNRFDELSMFFNQDDLFNCASVFRTLETLMEADKYQKLHKRWESVLSRVQIKSVAQF